MELEKYNGLKKVMETLRVLRS